MNVEKRVIKWLESSGIVSGYFVSGDKIKAKSLPEKFILVDRTGGAREAMVLDMAEILIEVYHKTSRFEASEKANAIADAVSGLLQYEEITRAKVNSVVHLDDTLGQYYRYQIYLDVYNRRGEAASKPAPPPPPPPIEDTL